jgi:hypothetical protein
MPTYNIAQAKHEGTELVLVVLDDPSFSQHSGNGRLRVLEKFQQCLYSQYPNHRVYIVWENPAQMTVEFPKADIRLKPYFQKLAWWNVKELSTKQVSCDVRIPEDLIGD